MTPVHLPSCQARVSAWHDGGALFRSTRSALAGRWYGAQDAWRVPLEAKARRRYGAQLRMDWGDQAMIYRLRDAHVPGREPIDVRVAFFANPYYDTYGLPPQDYPRVFADPGAPSPHRMPFDDALCLYYPRSAPTRRWRSTDGLLMLLDLVRDHLFFETHWRDTDRRGKGEWLGGEAPHGFARKGAA